MTPPDLTLADGDTLVDDPTELIYRQLAEWMVQNGDIMTHVFGPSTSDEGKPSYSRSSLVTAQEARDWHHVNAPSRSLGVWALSVDEVMEVERHVIDDSRAPVADDSPRAPGHCFVDFRGLSKAEVKSIRYLLYQRAIARGEIQTTEPTEDGELFA